MPGCHVTLTLTLCVPNSGTSAGRKKTLKAQSHVESKRERREARRGEQMDWGGVGTAARAIAAAPVDRPKEQTALGKGCPLVSDARLFPTQGSILSGAHLVLSALNFGSGARARSVGRTPERLSADPARQAPPRSHRLPRPPALPNLALPRPRGTPVSIPLHPRQPLVSSVLQPGVGVGHEGQGLVQKFCQVEGRRNIPMAPLPSRFFFF